MTQYIKAFIGRFQPFHDGHLVTLRAAIATSDLVVIVIGSAQIQSRTFKNPFSWSERRDMIAGALTDEERRKIYICGAGDMPGNDKEWVKQVKDLVRMAADSRFGSKEGDERNITLVGCHKGADTYYLKLYKGWGLDLTPVSQALNATDIRNAFFTNHNYRLGCGADADSIDWGSANGIPRDWATHLPPATYGFMRAFQRYNHEGFRTVLNSKENQS